MFGFLVVFTIPFLIFFIGRFLCHSLVRRRLRRRHDFIEDYTFPKRLSRQLKKTYPHLESEQITEIIDGLKDYFHVCLIAGAKRPVAMPSQAVDVAWHEFILFTRAYRDFCKKSFGRFLHHIPAEAMSAPQIIQVGIKNAWQFSCERDKVDPRFPVFLPLLFAIDEKYDIPDGFHYALDCSDRTSKKKQLFCASNIACSSDGSFFDGGDGDGSDGGGFFGGDGGDGGGGCGGGGCGS